jgi:hypothetical protein
LARSLVQRYICGNRSVSAAIVVEGVEGALSHLVAYECESGDEDEEDDEWDEVHDGAHGCGCGDTVYVVKVVCA